MKNNLEREFKDLPHSPGFKQPFHSLSRETRDWVSAADVVVVSG